MSRENAAYVGVRDAHNAPSDVIPPTTSSTERRGKQLPIGIRIGSEPDCLVRTGRRCAAAVLGFFVRITIEWQHND